MDQADAKVLKKEMRKLGETEGKMSNEEKG
jgi:hypothetical protein